MTSDDRIEPIALQNERPTIYPLQDAEKGGESSLQLTKNGNVRKTYFSVYTQIYIIFDISII